MEWITRPLGEITSYMAKGIPPKYTEEETENTVRVLNQKCNRNFTISYADSRIHDCTQKKVPGDKLLKKGDVLINSTGTGTAGRVAQMMEIPIPTTIDGHMILLRPSKEMDEFYYGYAVKAHQAQIETLAEGSTGQTEINRNRLQTEVMITYPENKKVQAGIASFLWDIDRKIEANNKINDNLAEMLQSIYQQRFNSYDSDKEHGVLADICGYSKDRVSVSSLSVSNYYSTENMLPGKAGAVDASSLPTITQTTKCKMGDVLISNIRPYFRKIVYCQSDCGCSTDVLCFSPKTSALSAYLFCTLYADRFFDFMVAGSKGTKMPRGDKQQIMTYTVHIPSDTELNEFNKLAKPMLAQIESNRLENISLSALRDCLLPKFMSGDIDISKINL